jgi:hypothetical protein
MPLFRKEQPEPVDILERPFTCTICGCDRFWRRTGRLRTGTGFYFAWGKPNAICFVCANCGYIHWFLPP